MDTPVVKSSSRIFADSKIFSPRLSVKGKHRENQAQLHHGSKLEQKIQNLRFRINGHVESPDAPPVKEPLKPMRYVRHFNVSVSLKKSRLLRFFCLSTDEYLSSISIHFRFLAVPIQISNNGRLVNDNLMKILKK